MKFIINRKREFQGSTRVISIDTPMGLLQTKSGQSYTIYCGLATAAQITITDDSLLQPVKRSYIIRDGQNVYINSGRGSVQVEII